MSQSKLRAPKKEAAKTLREIYERKRKECKASDALIESLSEPLNNQKDQKKSARKQGLFH